MYLLKERGQQTYAQFYSKFDIDSFGTKSEEEWGVTTPHSSDRISKYVGGAATPLDIKDWMLILNYVRKGANWTVNVYWGYVILVSRCPWYLIHVLLRIGSLPMMA